MDGEEWRVAIEQRLSDLEREMGETVVRQNKHLEEFPSHRHEDLEARMDGHAGVLQSLGEGMNQTQVGLESLQNRIDDLEEETPGEIVTPVVQVPEEILEEPETKRPKYKFL